MKNVKKNLSLGPRHFAYNLFGLRSEQTFFHEVAADGGCESINYVLPGEQT